MDSKPLQKPSGRPSASPADGAATAEAAAKVRYREGWRDGIMKSGASLLAGLLPMPHWRRRLDLAELAMKIAQTKAGTAPRDCLREASELMLAASDEIEWMERGRIDEGTDDAEAEAKEAIKQSLIGFDDETVCKKFAKIKDKPGMSGPAGWNLFCGEAGDSRPPFTFPDGLEWEPLPSKDALAEMVRSFLERRGRDADGADVFLQEIERGEATMQELYMLAHERNEHRWNDEVPWGLLCYEGSNVAPDPLKLPDGSTFQAFARSNRFKELANKFFEKVRIAEKVREEIVSERLSEFLKQAEAGKLTKHNLRGLARFRAKPAKSGSVKSSAVKSSAPNS